MTDTLSFVRASVPRGLRRLLEIGCGSGDLAAVLQRDGFEVTAIDEDEAAVAEARRKGVNAIVATWPEWRPTDADVVLFTRSLHHMRDVNAAIAAATAQMVLVEDFAYESCPAALIEWFVSEIRHTALDAESFAAKLIAADNVETQWRSEHDHDLATAEMMEAALRAHFTTVVATDTAYLYRYLGSADATLIERVANGEIAFAGAHGIRPLGRRFVAFR